MTPLIGAIVTGILAAIALFRGKKVPRERRRMGRRSRRQKKHPSSIEFKEFLEERVNLFLSDQDLDSFVQLVPEKKRAEFSAKFVKFIQAVVESSTATGLAILLKIENIERLQGVILGRSNQVLNKTTETLNSLQKVEDTGAQVLAKSTEALHRLDNVKDTIGTVADLSDKLATNLRYAEQINKTSRLIRENLNHASILTVLYFAAGTVSGLIGNVLSARTPFVQMPTPRLLVLLGLVLFVTASTQIHFAVVVHKLRVRLGLAAIKEVP